MSEYLQLPLYIYLTTAFIFGLMIGSFINVIAYRLPIMLNNSWEVECKNFLGLAPDTELSKKINLLFPGSHCPNCSHSLRFWENIPLLSYLYLRGKCSHCKSAIPLQYFLAEFACGLLSLIVVWQMGLTVNMLAALLLTWALIALSMIDIKHQLLPDIMTLPLLWLGLILNVTGLFCSLQAAVIGAVAGYLSLWLLAKIFFWVTGKMGMGNGDFKLLAVFGAWFGWQMLPLIIFLASFIGSVIAIALILLKKQTREMPIPFGPYLALAGWIAMIWGKSLVLSYWQFI